MKIPIYESQLGIEFIPHQPQQPSDPIGGAMQEFGSTFAKVSANIYEAIRDNRVAAETSEAQINSVKELNAFEESLRRDPDYDTYEQRYQELLADLKDRHGSAMSEPRAKTNYQRWIDVEAERRRSSIRSLRDNREIDAHMDTLNYVIEEGIKEKDLGIIADSVEAAMGTMLITEGDALKIIADAEHSIEIELYREHAFDLGHEPGAQYLMDEELTPNLTRDERTNLISRHNTEWNQRNALAKKDLSAQRMKSDLRAQKEFRSVRMGEMSPSDFFEQLQEPSEHYPGFDVEDVRRYDSLLRTLIDQWQRDKKGTTKDPYDWEKYSDPIILADLREAIYSGKYTHDEIAAELRKWAVDPDDPDRMKANRFIGHDDMDKMWNLLEKAKPDFGYMGAMKVIDDAVTKGTIEPDEGAKLKTRTHNIIKEDVRGIPYTADEQVQIAKNQIEERKQNTWNLFVEAIDNVLPGEWGRNPIEHWEAMIREGKTLGAEDKYAKQIADVRRWQIQEFVDKFGRVPAEGEAKALPSGELIFEVMEGDQKVTWARRGDKHWWVFNESTGLWERSHRAKRGNATLDR
jgi:hypothetical protein